MTLATMAGLNPWDEAAVDRIARDGVEVHTARPPASFDASRWSQLGRPAARWVRGDWPWRTTWAWTPGLQGILDDLLATRRFDVVAVEDNVLGVHQIAGDTPRVLTEHEARRSTAPAHGSPLRRVAMETMHRRNDRRWSPYLHATWRSFDVVQTFSEADAAVVRRGVGPHGPEVVVNPFGIRLPPLRTPSRDDGLIVFLGNYLHAPNLDAARWLADEIFPLVRMRRPDARMVLAGGSAPGWLQAVRESGVEVPGAVPDADELMSRAAVVVAPVRTGGGMRMKVLHAMSLGAAVVTTSLGSEGLTSGDRIPPLVIADDAEDFAAAIAGLLADPSRRRSLGGQARAFVARHHDPDAYAARSLETYRVAIERHGSGLLAARSGPA